MTSLFLYDMCNKYVFVHRGRHTLVCIHFIVFCIFYINKLFCSDDNRLRLHVCSRPAYMFVVRAATGFN